MLTIVFWNLAKRIETIGHLGCLAKSFSVDLFLLAECPIRSNGIAEQISESCGKQFREEFAIRAKVRAFTRFAKSEFAHRFSGLNRDIAVWSFSPDGGKELLVSGVHLRSKFGGQREASQSSIASEVVRELNEQENEVGHRNTVVLGDFNMHPYDDGMIGMTGWHGVMTAEIASEPSPIYRNTERHRFYNPMWGLFGDRTSGPPGSYFWDANVDHNPRWAILDQVLVRPQLVSKLSDVVILDNDGQHTLLDSNGKPTAKHISDHLPLLIKLDV